MKIKNIILIGGAGYIGTVLTDYLLSKEYKVTCIDLLLYSNRSYVYWICVDLAFIKCMA